MNSVSAIFKNGQVVLDAPPDWPEGCRLRITPAQAEGTANEAVRPESRRGPTSAEIAAMFKTDKPAPDDATVKKWLEEHRLEKYGK